MDRQRMQERKDMEIGKSVFFYTFAIHSTCLRAIS